MAQLRPTTDYAKLSRTIELLERLDNTNFSPFGDNGTYFNWEEIEAQIADLREVQDGLER